MKLRVKHNYTNRELQYRAGTVVDVSKEEARFLMADAPRSFAPYTKAGDLGSVFDERVVSALEGNGIATVAELRELLAVGEESVLALDGVGPATLRDIRKALDAPPHDKMIRGADVTK